MSLDKDPIRPRILSGVICVLLLAFGPPLGHATTTQPKVIGPGPATDFAPRSARAVLETGETGVVHHQKQFEIFDYDHSSAAFYRYDNAARSAFTLFGDYDSTDHLSNREPIPYGDSVGLNPLFPTPTALSGTLGQDHKLFQGAWTDPDTGIAYHRNRWYDPRTANWLSEDPLGAVDSPNLYAFVGWGPHVGRDPLGLRGPCDWTGNATCGDVFSGLGDMVGEAGSAIAENGIELRTRVGLFGNSVVESGEELYQEHLGSKIDAVKQRIAEARNAEANVDQLRFSYTDVYNDESLSQHLDGSNTGTGDLMSAYGGVVSAGGILVLTTADDISLFVGGINLAKYGLRSGMRVLIRSKKGKEELFEVVDEKLVRVYGDDVSNTKLIARIRTKLHLYPNAVDPRTGRNIPFPSAIRGRVDKSARVVWSKEGRGKFIAEWHRRGYATPTGGWKKYDIHHIQPQEFGGTNDFWNLVPLERTSTHQEFNRFWYAFTDL